MTKYSSFYWKYNIWIEICYKYEIYTGFYRQYKKCQKFLVVTFLWITMEMIIFWIYWIKQNIFNVIYLLLVFSKVATRKF